MTPFTYERPADLATALAAGVLPGARYIAGGTNLVDLMKADVETPRHLVDINDLPLDEIAEEPNGGLRIGALAGNTDVAADPRVRQHYPVLAQALLAGASGQLRNKATVGGNLLQRTRCFYFYDRAAPCNKRAPGSGCSALEGFNRIHAVLGTSDACIAVNPSDMSVAMVALDASVVTMLPDGSKRTIPVAELHRLPGDRPDLDHTLQRGELITAVILPPPRGGRQLYLKVRDRASYAFALVSVAAVASTRDGSSPGIRLVLGGLAHKPWRATAAEQACVRGCRDVPGFVAAAHEALASAKGSGHNDFKIALAERTLVQAMRHVMAPA